ncbi:MAG: VOC family protein [Marivibrio sp.]|uniref:VOC family protein n=1 Tax=Marivibrio sp. TaxID=2039719 RepID=UPI0032EEA50B
MTAYLEHIQYVSPDLDRMVEFYCSVFGWRLRGRGVEQAADRSYGWVHIGTDESYVAFRTPYDGARYSEDMAQRQTHFGVVVDDLDAVVARLKSRGFSVRPKGRHPFRERVYTRDPDGNEIEIIRYLSDKPSERNDYDLDG